MFSASTENGPVTPRMVNGWLENLHLYEHSIIVAFRASLTYSAKIMPQSPVLKTTSIVPQVMPVRT
jgi:hypothetical protein